MAYMEPDPLRVLVIQDPAGTGARLGRELEEIQEPTFQALEARNLESGLDLARREQVDAVILAGSPGDATVEEATSRLQQTVPRLPVVVLLESPGPDVLRRLVAAGAQEVVVGPGVDATRLAGAVVQARERIQRAGDLAHSIRAAEERERRFRSALDHLLEPGRYRSLSPLAELAATVAHEINNPLQVITGYGEILASSARLDPPLRHPVTAIRDAARRCAMVVSHLVDLAGVLEEAAGPRQPAQEPRSLRVLVADDEAEIRQMCRLYLESEGHRVRDAWSAGEALTWLESEAVDVLLLDHALPGGESSPVLDHLATSGTRVPIVLMVHQLNQIPPIADAGSMTVRVLRKPFRMADLRAALASLQPGPSSVLLVEDETVVRETLAAALVERFPAVTVHAAGDAYEAGRVLGRVTPEAILLDLVLPGINGIDLCRRIRSEPETRHTPLIVLSGAIEERDRGRLEELGASAVLLKPLDGGCMKTLLETLERLCRPAPDGLEERSRSNSPG